MSVESIVSVTCHEPESDVTRHVYKMPLSLENLKRFWENASKFRTLFTAEINNDFTKFCEIFLHQNGGTVEANGLVYVIDDFTGVFYMTNIIPSVDASVHYSFFDRRHKGREILIHECLKYAFIHFGFRRLSTEVPLFLAPTPDKRYAVEDERATGIFKFVEALGFVKEGRKRKAMLYKNDWFDVNQYGILREEVLDGR